MGQEVCLYNQTGFCKFRQHCRKEHENQICQEDHDFKSTGCTLRHPKVCRSFRGDGSCKFKSGCAYKHENNQEAEMVKNHDQEVMNLQMEMSQMKCVIKQMEARIEFLHEALENVQKTNIGEIVAIVAASLESKKESSATNDSKEVEIAENCIDCDECSFKCNNEWEMIRHMSKEHEETLKQYCSCDNCATYFATRHLLKIHNEKEHIKDVQVEYSSTAESEICDHECKQCPIKFNTLDELQWHIKENHDRKLTKKKQNNKKK